MRLLCVSKVGLHIKLKLMQDVKSICIAIDLTLLFSRFPQHDIIDIYQEYLMDIIILTPLQCVQTNTYCKEYLSMFRYDLLCSSLLVYHCTI